MMKAMTLIMTPIKNSLKMKQMAKKVKKKKKKMSKIGMMKRMCLPDQKNSFSKMNLIQMPVKEKSKMLKKIMTR